MSSEPHWARVTRDAARAARKAREEGATDASAAFLAAYLRTPWNETRADYETAQVAFFYAFEKAGKERAARA